MMLAQATSVYSDDRNSQAGDAISNYQTNMDDIAVEASLSAKMSGRLIAHVKKSSTNWGGNRLLQNSLKLTTIFRFRSLWCCASLSKK